MNLIIKPENQGQDLPDASGNQPVANNREPKSKEQRLIEWIFKIEQAQMVSNERSSVEPNNNSNDDWHAVTSLCGHDAKDFAAACLSLPLTAHEIDYFRRNHREKDNTLNRAFLQAQSDLPSPLNELYGLYRHRVRLDTEAALFVAQSTGSTRVASTMADLLAIGGFANGNEFVTYLTMTYSVPAAFDTSDLIDRANQEATRRLTLPADHPAHLLTLTPDEIGVLAANIVERHVLNTQDFLEKANLLAEARQDVNRLERSKHFVTAIGERDLPLRFPWVSRICAAYARLFENWVIGMPEIEALMNQKAEIRYQ